MRAVDEDAKGEGEPETGAGVGYEQDTERGAARPALEERALVLVLLRCRGAHGDERGAASARRGEGAFLGGGVGGLVVHVGFGGWWVI